MLTCITCSKQREEDDEGSPRGTPKDAIKTLTTQIKDMALKVSGSSKQKPDITNFHHKKPPRYPGSDDITYPSGQRTLRPDSRFSGPRESTGREPMLEDEDEPKEWIAQVEPGVQITFVSLPQGGNDLKRIRFSRETFNKWQAQRWWGENYERIMELYNVQKFNQQALNTTPGRSEDGRDSTYSRLGSVAMESPRMTPSVNKEWTQRYNRPLGGSNSFPHEQTRAHYGVGSSSSAQMEASRTTTSSRDDDDDSVSLSNASEVDSEWIEEDEPGVYITIRQLMDGTRELRRVRFSRERFGECNAKQWWETNRDRIQAQYLS